MDFSLPFPHCTDTSVTGKIQIPIGLSTSWEPDFMKLECFFGPWGVGASRRSTDFEISQTQGVDRVRQLGFLLVCNSRQDPVHRESKEVLFYGFIGRGCIRQLNSSPGELFQPWEPLHLLLKFQEQLL